MATRILPSNPQEKDEKTTKLLNKIGEAGVTLSQNTNEKTASAEGVKKSKKTASIEKTAVTKEEQAEYWRQYFEQAGLNRDYEDWLDILFG
jgi:hypothetical protein